MNCGAKNVFEIYITEDKTLFFKAINADTGDPLDLTSCTEIVLTLPKNDGTTVLRKLSLGQVVIESPAVLCNCNAPIPKVIAATLNVGALQNFSAAFTIGGLVTVVPYPESLSVFEP